MDLPDHQLLDRYAAAHDERAFRLLVERHLPLVHGTARRVTGNDELARDAAQAVFIRLAERAALIPADLPLPAWLHRITRHLAIDLVRSEDQRKKRERSTGAAAVHPSMNDFSHATPEPAWTALAPVIDELVNRLPESDRKLLLLRFYANEPHSAIARQMGLSEEAARKRGTRALEKLRVLLGRRGIATTASALATLLPAHAATPAPPALMTSVLGAAQGVAPILPHGLNLHLAMTVAQKVAIAAAALVFLSSIGYAVRRSPEDDAAATAMASTGPAAEEKATAARQIRPVRPAGTPEERQVRLREIVAIPSSVKRLRALFAFTDTLPAESFAEAADFLRAGQKQEGLNLLETLTATWAKRDPVRAGEWAIRSEEALPQQLPAAPRYLDIVMQTWADQEPSAAVAWLVRRRPETTGGAREARAPLIAALSGLAESDPAEAVKLLDVIPGEKDREAALLEMACSLSRRRADLMPEILAAMEKGPARSNLLSGIAATMALHSQGEVAFRELLADQEAQKKLSLENFFATWTSQESGEARQTIDGMDAGSQRDQAVAGWCMSSAADPQEALQLLEQYPTAVTDRFMDRFTDRLIPSSPGTAPLMEKGLAQVLRMHDPALREQALTRVLTLWMKIWPEDAAGWAKGRDDLPPAARAALQTPTSPEGP